MIYGLLLIVPGASDVYLGRIKGGLGTLGLFLLSVPLLLAFGLGIPWAILVWLGNFATGVRALLSR